MKVGNIQIVEKPDWVLWDEIHKVVYASHAENRKNGIVMKLPSLSGSEIQKIMGPDGKMFVAIDGAKVVGTAAVRFREVFAWYHKGKAAYFCFASVLPEYNGMGIYKLLCEARYSFLKNTGISVVFADTHVRNHHVQQILKKQDYKWVGVRRYDDHYNVLMFKWLGGCPFSHCRIRYEYCKSVIKVKILRPIVDSIRKIFF